LPDVGSLVAGARREFEAGNPFTAELFYRQVLKATEPVKNGTDRVARGEAAMFFALRALARSHVGESGDWYKVALSADPRASNYRADFVSKVLLPLGMMKVARQEAERAVKIDPEEPKAWLALGMVQYEEGDGDASRVSRTKALSLRPGDPYLMLELARVELDTGRYDAVTRLCDVIMTEHPERTGDALYFLAMVAYREGRHQDAIDLYNRVLETECSDPLSIKLNRALPLHSLGRYAEGWADYETRGETNEIHAVPFRRFEAPVWRGQPAPASIHLHEEMGYGDTLAMARYAPLLASMGYDVRLEVRDELIDLFARSFPGVTVLPRAVDFPGGLGIPRFDYHLPLLSCPHSFGTTVETVPWSGPYLRADPEKAARYDALLPRGLRVGLSWSSGIRAGIWLGEYGRRKSVKLEQLKPIWEYGPEVFVSLQMGPEVAEADGLPQIVSPLTPDSTWDDTAALVSCLDLVVTVDTAVAHLTGALGKPMKVLMHTEGSWHWMADVEGTPWQKASPWYPTARLYRQRRPHEWDEVVAEVAGDLRA
jgi:tetratricopeptide (TPR) repeat protein